MSLARANGETIVDMLAPIVAGLNQYLRSFDTFIDGCMLLPNERWLRDSIFFFNICGCRKFVTGLKRYLLPYLGVTSVTSTRTLA